MINTLKRWAPLACGMFMVVTPALAQAPSEAQREAIKSQCRSDYMAHCSSIPPGGEASLQCLQKNMASLSAGCAGAVRAAEPAAAPKAETAPSAAPKTEPPAAAAKPAETAAPKEAAKETSKETTKGAPKAAAGAAPKQPTSAQVSAIRSACRSDYPKLCAGVPTGGAPALQCLEKNKAKASAGCQQAVNAASGGGAAPAAGSATATATAAPDAAVPAAAPTVLVLRPMLPREELFVLRSACSADVRALCGGVAPGGGRIMLCLANKAADISPACKDVLTQFAAR